MERIEKEYMPLSGKELLEVIFQKGKQLAGKYSHYFGPHVAFHNPKIAIAIKVDCYTPLEENGPPPIVDVGGFELVIHLQDQPVFFPDQIREELGLGTYETQLVDEKSGVLADVKVGARETEMPKAGVEATLEKVNRFLDGESKPRRKTKKTRKRGGWPKGKPRGPKKDDKSVAHEASV